MFVKHSWFRRGDKKYEQYHIAESYWDPEKKQSRHHLLLNITKLPDHVIQAIDESLKKGKKVTGKDVEVTTGDAVRGAGLLALYRMWKDEGMEKVLRDLTQAERQSVLAMVVQRVLEPDPGGKLALQEQLKDTILAKVLSATRLDEDELYEVMDKLEENFYQVQEKLNGQLKALGQKVRSCLGEHSVERWAGLVMLMYVLLAQIRWEQPTSMSKADSWPSWREVGERLAKGLVREGRWWEGSWLERGLAHLKSQVPLFEPLRALLDGKFRSPQLIRV